MKVDLTPKPLPNHKRLTELLSYVQSQMPDVQEGQCAYCGNFDKAAQPVNELVEALREAAAFIHAVNTGEKPEVRYPLADELDGYAAILANAKEQVQPSQGEWHHCSPALLASGVDCKATPRRNCECDHGGSHDHFVTALLQSNAERVPLTDARIKELSEGIFGIELDYQYIAEIKFARAIETEILKGQQ